MLLLLLVLFFIHGFFIHGIIIIIIIVIMTIVILFYVIVVITLNPKPFILRGQELASCVAAVGDQGHEGRVEADNQFV